MRGVEGEAGIVLAVEEDEAAGGTGALAEEMDDFTERPRRRANIASSLDALRRAQGRPRAWRQAETAWWRSKRPLPRSGEMGTALARDCSAQDSLQRELTPRSSAAAPETMGALKEVPQPAA